MVNNDLQTIEKRFDEIESILRGICGVQDLHTYMLSKVILAQGMETPSKHLSELCGGRQEVLDWLKRVESQRDYGQTVG